MRAVRELPIDVAPVVEDVVDRFEVRLEYRRRFVRGGDGPLCLMTQRRRLDAHLAEQAAAAGADLRDGVKVDDVELNGDSVAATVGGARIRAKALVGADGVNGVTARALGLDGRELGVALEGNLPYDRLDRDRYAGRLVLEVGVVPGGYGWAFPKRDHVNFGIGGWESEGPRLRDHLRRLCAAHGVEPDELTDLRGYRLPMRRPDSGLVRGHALLVGDAAGLVDPVSGDGIYEALVSAQLAAEAITTGTIDTYASKLRERLDPLASAGWGAKVALDRFPRAVFAIMRLPVTWSALEKVVTGEVRDPASTRGVERRAMKLIEALARRAGDPGRAYEAPPAAPA